MPTTLLRPYTAILDVQRETKNSGSELEDWYLECINLASRFVEEHCRRDFWFHNFTGEDSYRVKRIAVLGDLVALPFPILSIESVRVFSDIEQTNNDNDLLDSDEYYFDEGSGNLMCEKGDFGSHPFRNHLWIKGTFGYELSPQDPDITPPPSLPAQVRRATTLIASAFSDEMHKEQVALDGSRVELLTTMVPNEAISLLKRWRYRIGVSF